MGYALTHLAVSCSAQANGSLLSRDVLEQGMVDPARQEGLKPVAPGDGGGSRTRTRSETSRVPDYRAEMQGREERAALEKEKGLVDPAEQLGSIAGSAHRSRSAAAAPFAFVFASTS